MLGGLNKNKNLKVNNRKLKQRSESKIKSSRLLRMLGNKCACLRCKVSYKLIIKLFQLILNKHKKRYMKADIH